VLATASRSSSPRTCCSAASARASIQLCDGGVHGIRPLDLDLHRAAAPPVGPCPVRARILDRMWCQRNLAAVPRPGAFHHAVSPASAMAAVYYAYRCEFRGGARGRPCGVHRRPAWSSTPNSRRAQDIYSGRRHPSPDELLSRFLRPLKPNIAALLTARTLPYIIPAGSKRGMAWLHRSLSPPTRSRSMGERFNSASQSGTSSVGLLPGRLSSTAGAPNIHRLGPFDVLPAILWCPSHAQRHRARRCHSFPGLCGDDNHVARITFPDGIQVRLKEPETAAGAITRDR